MFVTLDQLKAIITVAEKGSFRSAALQLGKSQPALSTTIKNFEEEFGIVLFDRKNYRPTLTEAGAAFLEVGRAALEATNHASRCAFELGKNEVETTLHVSVNGLIPTEYVQLIVQQCLKPNPP